MENHHFLSIFNRRYIFIHGWFSGVYLRFRRKMARTWCAWNVWDLVDQIGWFAVEPLLSYANSTENGDLNMPKSEALMFFNWETRQKTTDGWSIGRWLLTSQRKMLESQLEHWIILDPKLWALEKVTPALDMAIFGIDVQLLWCTKTEDFAAVMLQWWWKVHSVSRTISQVPSQNGKKSCKRSRCKVDACVGSEPVLWPCFHV